jgi:hypothetical protein
MTIAPDIILDYNLVYAHIFEGERVEVSEPGFKLIVWNTMCYIIFLNNPGL